MKMLRRLHMCAIVTGLIHLGMTSSSDVIPSRCDVLTSYLLVHTFFLYWLRRKKSDNDIFSTSYRFSWWAPALNTTTSLISLKDSAPIPKGSTFTADWNVFWKDVNKCSRITQYIFVQLVSIYENWWLSFTAWLGLWWSARFRLTPLGRHTCSSQWPGRWAWNIFA